MDPGIEGQGMDGKEAWDPRWGCWLIFPLPFSDLGSPSCKEHMLCDREGRAEVNFVILSPMLLQLVLFSRQPRTVLFTCNPWSKLAVM